TSWLSSFFVVFSVLFLYSIIFICHSPSPSDFYTLSLHDALPIYRLGQLLGPVEAGAGGGRDPRFGRDVAVVVELHRPAFPSAGRSEEHTSELQSRFDLVCRLLLEKKNETIRHDVLSYL